jgi:uncharacterized protein YdeI (YjbR/CyaY-like superfamily)
MVTFSEIESLKIHSIQELENWLELNCTTSKSIWLIFPKKSAGANFSMTEIIDVLLCFGWIDSLPRKVDENYTSVRISPRNPKSYWSKVNKDKVIKLLAENKIKPNG